jgi:hypothetical protein
MNQLARQPGPDSHLWEPPPPHELDQYRYFAVEVYVYDRATGEEVRYYTTDLANTAFRRNFDEQMVNVCTGGQYVVVSPIKAELKTPEQLAAMDRKRRDRRDRREH